MERSGVLRTTQFVYRKGLGNCDALLCVSQTLQSELESGQDARIVQIDFSAGFDRVNHVGILCKLCSVSIGGSVLEYCSAVWCSVADTHIKLPDRVVSGACFLASGVLN